MSKVDLKEMSHEELVSHLRVQKVMLERTMEELYKRGYSISGRVFLEEYIERHKLYLNINKSFAD